jgi:hypothetical protein
MVTSPDTVVEAISRGVVTRSVERFFASVDDFLILKPRFCSRESMKTAGEQAAEYVGYPYNYTFRPDEDSVYCSELIFRAYAKTPEWKRIDKTSAKGILEYNDGAILLPHSFSEAKRLWQRVIPAGGDPAGSPIKCIVKYRQPVFLQVELP